MKYTQKYDDLISKSFSYKNFSLNYKLFSLVSYLELWMRNVNISKYGGRVGIRRRNKKMKWIYGNEWVEHMRTEHRNPFFDKNVTLQTEWNGFFNELAWSVLLLFLGLRFYGVFYCCYTERLQYITCEYLVW